MCTSYQTPSSVTLQTSGTLTNECLLSVSQPPILLWLSVNCEIANADCKSITLPLQTDRRSFTPRTGEARNSAATDGHFTAFCAYSQRPEHREFTSDMIMDIAMNVTHTTYIQLGFFCFPLHVYPTMASLAQIQEINLSCFDVLQMVSPPVFYLYFFVFMRVPEG